MNPKFVGLLVGLLVVLGSGAYAVDQYDFLLPSVGTQPVAIMGGDTIGTYQVSCSSNTLAAGATKLRSAITAGPANQSTGRPLRNRCFQNVGNVAVAIGSSTVAASDFWIIGSSTPATGIPPVYCTHSSAAVYCAPASGNSAQTVNVIEETESLP